MEKEEGMPQLEATYIMNTISWTNIIIIMNIIIMAKIIMPNYIKTQECLNKIT